MSVWLSLGPARLECAVDCGGRVSDADGPELSARSVDRVDRDGVGDERCNIWEIQASEASTRSRHRWRTEVLHQCVRHDQAPGSGKAEMYMWNHNWGIIEYGLFI